MCTKANLFSELIGKIFCRMAEALCSYIEQDRPFLGICLGLQLLFESSEENGPGKEIGKQSLAIR